MATRETSRLHIPYPGEDDPGSWDAKFVAMLAQIDTRIFANLENLKPIYAALPTVENVVATGLVQTGDWEIISRTFNATITVAAATLPLVANTMIGVRITAGAVANQASVWETVPNGADVDAEFQVFGYVDTALTVRWYNGASLAVGESATLFQDATLSPAVEAVKEDADIRVGGGGSVTLVGDVLTWSAPIVVTSPRSGGTITIAAGSIGLLAGEFLYVVPSTRPVPTEAGTPLAAAVVPDAGIALAARLGTQVVLRNERRRGFALTVAHGSEVATGTATSGGGTTNFALGVGVSRGVAHRLRVQAAGNTVNSDISLYADAARTELVWSAVAQDCYTGGVPPYLDRRETWPLTGWTTDLVDGVLYGTITNNGANNSTYVVEITGEGEV